MGIDYDENDSVAHYWRDNVPIIKNKNTYYSRNKIKLNAYKAKQNLKKVAPVQSFDSDPMIENMYMMYANVSEATKRKASSTGSNQSGPKKQDADHTSDSPSDA